MFVSTLLVFAGFGIAVAWSFWVLVAAVDRIPARFVVLRALVLMLMTATYAQLAEWWWLL